MGNQTSTLLIKLNKIYASKGALNLTHALFNFTLLCYLAWQLYATIQSGEGQVNIFIAKFTLILSIYTVVKMISMELSLSSIKENYLNLKSSLIMKDIDGNEISGEDASEATEEFLSKIINNIQFDIIVLKLAITAPIAIVLFEVILLNVL